MILPDDIGYALSDGVVLCHFINQIRPRSVQSIHVPSQAVVRIFSEHGNQEFHIFFLAETFLSEMPTKCREFSRS